ncbi:MAG: hypothetical protein Q9212_003694 [Teloschistes hypoglaucus]
MAEVSSTRLYLGNLPREVTKEDIQNHFKDAPGTISEVKLMNGFGFIEYEDAMDARDVVPTYHGSDLNGSRLTVQFARGTRQRDPFTGPPERPHPRPRRTAHRMQISGLPGETSWQVSTLDIFSWFFPRGSGYVIVWFRLDVVYSEVGRDRDGKGFVEFETAGDLKTAVEKLDNNDFKGTTVRCLADVSTVPRFAILELLIDHGLSPRTRSPATTAMADPALRHLDVVHTLRMDTTTVARLHLVSILLAAVVMNIAVVVLHLAITTSTSAMIADTALRPQCVLVAAHPWMIPTHPPEAVMSVTPTLLRLHDVPTMIRMPPMGMGGQGREARRRGITDMMDGSILPHFLDDLIDVVKHEKRHRIIM